MKETKFNRVVITMSYPLSLLLIIGLLALVPIFYELSSVEVSDSWVVWRVVVLSSIIPMGLYLCGLSVIRTWNERVIYCLCNSFILYVPCFLLFICLLIKSFVLLAWQSPHSEVLVFHLIFGGFFSCAALLISMKIIQN